MKQRCPICNKVVKTPHQELPEEAKFFPFCSQRCKLIDLGTWLDARYKIPVQDESDQSQKKPTQPPTDNNGFDP